MSELEDRIRENELQVAKLAESLLDLRTRVDDHKDYCPIPSYKESTDKTIAEINSKFNTTLGIIVTVLIIAFSSISYLQQNKVSDGIFKTTITEIKQEEIRRDERIQMLTENQQRLQIELIKEMNLVKIEITKLSNNLGRRND